MAIAALTAIAAIPLSSISQHRSVARDLRPETAVDWLSFACTSVARILLVSCGITHALIGVRSVVLDYVHTRAGAWQPELLFVQLR